MTTYSQDPAAILDYAVDWSAELTANGSATISSCTVTGPATVTITSATHTTTAVTFRLAVAGVTTVPSVVSIVVHVVLSTGEEDERTVRVQVTNR